MLKRNSRTNPFLQLPSGYPVWMARSITERMI